jgi:hypothetical protein
VSGFPGVVCSKALAEILTRADVRLVGVSLASQDVDIVHTVRLREDSRKLADDNTEEVAKPVAPTVGATADTCHSALARDGMWRRGESFRIATLKTDKLLIFQHS